MLGNASEPAVERPWQFRILVGTDRAWGHLRSFAYGMWIARVSAASVLVGALLFYYGRPAQDLFLEVGDRALLSVGYWGLFYLVVLAFWVFPVYLSARWVLARIDGVRVPPVEDWVRRRIPALLATGCLGAVLIGQVLAVSNAPILLDQAIEDDTTSILNQQIKTACSEHSGDVTDIFQEIWQSKCRISIGLLIAGARGVGLSAASGLGSDNVILVVYAICAAVLFWMFFKRRLTSIREKSRLSLQPTLWWLAAGCIFVPCVLLVWVTYPLLLSIAFWKPFFPSLVKFTNEPVVVFGVLYPISGIVSLLFWWRRAEVIFWWLFTIAIVGPTILITFLIAAGFVERELEQPYGLWHLALLLPTSAVLGVLVWWGLGPRADGMATRIGQGMIWIQGKHGTIDEATATMRLVNPIFAILAAIAIVGLILLVLVVPPVDAARNVVLFRRALLIPFFLGMLVPPLTMLSSWSMRARAPLILGAVLLIAVGSQLFTDPHKVRIEPTEARLRTLDESLQRWAAANGCELSATEGSTLACPAPIIVAAAGGASRAAFHVAGLLGTLMDGVRPQVVLRTNTAVINDVAFSADSRRILTRSADRVARLWDGERGTQVAAMRHEGYVYSAVFGAGGQRILTSSSDTTARVWNGERGTLIATLKHDAAVIGAAFSSDGRRILTRSSDRTARIWDGETGAQISVLRHDGPIYSAIFSPDGRRIATRSADQTVRLWDGESGASIALLRHDKLGNQAEFSKDGRRLLTISGMLARLWDGESGAHIADLRNEAEVTSADFTRDGRRILTRSADRTARIWNGENGSQTAILKHDAPVEGMIFSQDGRRIVTRSGNVARLWDGDNGTEIAALPHHDKINSLLLSPDFRLIVTSSSDNTAGLWEAERGTPIASMRHDSTVVGARFSPDGRRILTRSSDRTARLWNSETGAQIAVLRHEGKVNSAIFSPDSRRIMTRSADKTARMWDGISGAPILLGPARELRSFGRQLFAISGVSGGALGAVILYAGLADSQAETTEGANLRPPCAAGAELGELFASHEKEHPQNPHESWKDCLQLILAGDFLSPVFVSMIGGDLLGVLPEDRTVVLEKSWEARYAATTQARSRASSDSRTGAPKAESTLAQPMLAIRDRVLERDPKGWLPILLLNGTSVQTGRRIIASDIDVRGLFQDAYDLHDAFGQPDAKERESERRKTWDIRLSTAATISARFPGISPHGDLVKRKGKAVFDRVVDGGYYESFGASTALELVEALEKLKEKRKHYLKPLVILVNNEPGMQNLDCGDLEGEPLMTPKPDAWALFASWSSPIDAVLGTRRARGTHAAAQLCNAITADRFAFVTVSQQEGFTKTKKELSMSWWISKYIQRYLDLELIKTNAHAMEKILGAR